MFALLDTDDVTVIAVFPPDVPSDKIIEEANGRTLIEVTLENSPGYIGGSYNKEENKFYPAKELMNG